MVVGGSLTISERLALATVALIISIIQENDSMLKMKLIFMLKLISMMPRGVFLEVMKN